MNSRRPDDDREDAELLREVHKALKACGWLPPETIDEVREAEQALEREPVEVPEELLDPRRLWDAPLDGSTAVAPSTPELERPPMPSGLARVVQEFGLTPEQTGTLIEFQAQMMFNRSAGKRDETSYEDWKKFYLGVKDYL